MNIAITTPATPAAFQICSIQRIAPYIQPEEDWEQFIPHFHTEILSDYDIAQEIDPSHCALTPVFREALMSIFREHADALVGPDGHLGHCNGPVGHRVDPAEGSAIPARKVHRVPLEKRIEIEKTIMQMLKDGIVRESQSPSCAPILLVRKRDVNSLRFTIDLRRLNAITKPQQSILPNVQDILDLCDNQCLYTYTSLDSQQGFYQIPLEESHCGRTAFACFLGAFEYVRMPMGLEGGPAISQRIMDDMKKYL
ncbi:hypothetical protein ANCDUO_07138 [Ancylostoma duodenale]|uniref:Reverse transcriptase domain-containing protein n=1 Tax=Ancylostoma duodenale TaxID=51022 RepID=A0A0C2CZT6_9BILA|nr:hypothetical protein ANCDUO_07138 [Ancylostoma duodenale]